jgi:pimeloyl-ACP methyl ester carboxylesterase
MANAAGIAAALAAGGLFAAVWGMNADAAPPKAPAIVMEEFAVPAADDAAIKLYVRNKHPQGMAKAPAERILLYVHGATYPAETAFDLSLGGFSWMDYIAQRGWDVYLVDVRGYGRSSRPAAMDKPAGDGEPIVDTKTAVADVGAAVEFIRKRRGVAKINLIGWSWGTSIMGWYTAQNNDKVAKLVLYAPQWLSDPNTRSLTAPGGSLGTYRTVTIDQARTRWLTGVAPEKARELIPNGWFDTWAAATWATDPAGARQSPPVIRAPNGVIADSQAYWRVGKPLYDPGAITVPTMLVHAEWDADLPSYQAQGYFARLTNVPYKRFVEIGEGTHTVIMEKNRLQLFQEVQLFLDEGRPTFMAAK